MILNQLSNNPALSQIDQQLKAWFGLISINTRVENYLFWLSKFKSKYTQYHCPYQQFFFMYNTLFPLKRISFHQLKLSPPFISFAFVSNRFMVPSRHAKVPLQNVSLSLSLTSTALPRSCLMKSPGLVREDLVLFMRWIQCSYNTLRCDYKLMIGALLETILLFINAIAILNEKRFLKKHGFSTVAAPNSPNEEITSKSQAIMAMVTLRSIGKYFLIPLNVVAILLQVLG